MCFHCRGRAFWWLVLATGLPTLRTLHDPAQRRWLCDTLADLWLALHDPSASLRCRCQAAACFVVLPAALLFLSTHRTLGGGDSWPVVPTACSLVREGNAELSEYLDTAPDSYRAGKDGLPYCVHVTPRGVFSGYPSGMVVFALPVTAAARLVAADLDRPTVHLRLEKWTAAWVAAVCVGLFFLLALRLAEPGPAWLATLLLTAGSVMFSTVSHGLWQHGGVIFWALLVLLGEFGSPRPSLAVTLLQGAALGMMVPCRLSSALFIVPFGAWVLLRSPGRAVVLTLAALTAYFPWAAFYLCTDGTLLGPSTGQMAGIHWSTETLTALCGVLFSPARGLFVYQPWLLLAVLALVPAVRRQAVTGTRLSGQAPPSGWPWFCLTVIVLQVALVSAWHDWWGGHCWGSRLLAEVVPLAALLCVAPVAVLLRTRPGRVVLASLLGLAFLLHAAGVYRETRWEARVDIDHHPEMFWSLSRAPFLLPAPE
jgi:hypothetical protein